MENIAGAAALWARVLTFRASRRDLQDLRGVHLAGGILATWLVGMGRYWDHPRANLLQYLGTGSVAYVFVLAAILWLSFGLLHPRHHSYRGILTFITMTSPPAMLYAIPVERFTDPDTAAHLNIGFLAAVACWRIALVIFYAMRALELPAVAAAAGLALPVLGIIVSLAILNLDHVVFDFMGGIEKDRSGVLAGREAAYMATLGLTWISILAFIPTLLVYAGAVFWRSPKMPPDPSLIAPGPGVPTASGVQPPTSSP